MESCNKKCRIIDEKGGLLHLYCVQGKGHEGKHEYHATDRETGLVVIVKVIEKNFTNLK